MNDESGGRLIADARDQARGHLVVALGLLLKAGGPVTAIDYVLDAVRELELLEQSRRGVGQDE
jgi:hypothetical protein